MKLKLNEEKGSVVVEASITLPIFILAMFFVINLINIFILHNKIQFAINMAAHEMAAYSYLYERTELRAAESRLQEDGKEYTEKIDETVASVRTAIDEISKTIDSAKAVIERVGEVFESMEAVSDNLESLQNKIKNLPDETKNKMNDIKAKIGNAQTTFINAINNVKNITKSNTPKEALENANKIIESGKADKEELDEIKNAVIQYMDTVKGISDEAKAVYESIKEVIEKGKEAVEQGKETIEQGKKAFEAGKVAANNVIDRIKNIRETLIGVGFGAGEGAAYFTKNKLGAFMYEKVTEKYLDSDFLKKYGIEDGFKGISFKQSTYLNDKDKRMIDILVSYEVKLTPFKLVFSKTNLKVTQRVTIPAWLDGDEQKVNEALKAG